MEKSSISMTRNENDVIEVCKLRQDLQMRCADCVFYQNQCERVKEKYKVSKPCKIKLKEVIQ